MVNKNKWVSNYNDLDPDNQLLVAEAIANELSDNEMTFDKDEYDKEKSRIVREFFNLIRNDVKQSDELKKLADVFAKYENLSQNNRKKVINEIFEIIAKYINIQEQENKTITCKDEGHIFGKWKHNKWTEYVDTVIDHQHVHDYPIKYENWIRTCSRCGFIDEVEQEPKELIEKRKEKNKKLKIEKMKSE